MIEVSIDEIDGVRFYKNIRVLEADDKVNGVPVHNILRHWSLDGEFIRAIKALGMRKIGIDYYRDADLYVTSNLFAWQFKVNGLALKVYWVVVKWLYNNARFFKMIPPEERFSWRYFTPYCWYRAIKAKRIWEMIKRWNRGE